MASPRDRSLANWGRLLHKYRQAASYPPPPDLPPGPARDAHHRAKLLHDRGDLEGALALYQEAGRLYRELGNREGAIAALENRARIVQDRADFDGAMALCEEAESLYRELGNRDDVAVSLRNQAQILRDARDPDRALELLALMLFAFRAEVRQLQFAPFHSSGIYRLGERAGWTVSPAPGASPPDAQYAYEIRRNNRVTIQSGALRFASGSAIIETALDEPAMLHVTVHAEGAPPASAIHLGAAIEPTRLRPSLPAPDDFDSFWSAKLRELGRIPLNPTVTQVAASDGVELSKVQIDSWGSRAHGYLAMPARPGRFPALVIFQYAGVYALRPDAVIKRASEGWLALDMVSHDHPPDQAGGVSEDYELLGSASRETCYFLAMYLRAVRALDFVASHPGWDGRTLVLMGTCMGAQQALAAAGLRPQVTAVIADQPSGADCCGDLHGRKPGYPYWPSGDPRVMAAAPYFDIVNFAPRIQAPVLASMGFVDTTSPPAGIWTMLNQLAGPKEIVTMIELDHTSRTPEKRAVFRTRAAQVLDTLLRGGRFQP